MKTLRFDIDGRWTTSDFAEFFQSITHLYSLSVLVELEREDAHEIERFYRDFRKFSDFGPFPRRMWRSLSRVGINPGHFGEKLISSASIGKPFDLLEEREQLRVRRCSYASPGNIDIVGLGQAVGHVKEIVNKVIDVRVDSVARNIRNGILEEERKAAALRNLKEQISILKELGYSEAEIRLIVAKSTPAIEAISGLGDRGLVLNVREIEGNDG